MLTFEELCHVTLCAGKGSAPLRQSSSNSARPVERGMVPLRGDGMRKVAAGLTTVHEILRVTEATI